MQIWNKHRKDTVQFVSSRVSVPTSLCTPAAVDVPLIRACWVNNITFLWISFFFKKTHYLIRQKDLTADFILL